MGGSTPGPPRSGGCGGRSPRGRSWISWAAQGWGALAREGPHQRRRLGQTCAEMRERRMGQAHRRCNILVFSSGRRVRLLLSSVFSFVYLSIPFLCFGGLGAKEIGRPTRIDHFDLGQDMVLFKIPLLSARAAASRCHGPSGRM